VNQVTSLRSTSGGVAYFEHTLVVDLLYKCNAVDALASQVNEAWTTGTVSAALHILARELKPSRPRHRVVLTMGAIGALANPQIHRHPQIREGLL